MNKNFYKHIDLNFKPLEDVQSGFRDNNGDFYPLLGLIEETKKQNCKKEKIYINSMKHFVRREVGAMEMAEAYRRIEKADTNIPIILHWDGTILDGFHRIVKCILTKKERIYGYRIDIKKIKPENDIS